MDEKTTSYREKCLRCFRPVSSCMCKHITKIDTNTKFAILIHPKEFRKIRNNTGRMTHLALPNSLFIMGDDFTHDKQLNHLIATHNTYLLYPGDDSLKLNAQKLISKNNKKDLILILDATWPCSRKMIKLSKNLQALPKVSFKTDITSIYQIKSQPQSFCLSTIESTKILLECLNNKNEMIDQSKLENFLNPFKEMIKYQIGCINDPHKPRYKRDKDKLGKVS
jgi:DTW domain-containing protein YfiP